MTGRRLVEDGEHISLIAEEFGFARFETILEAPENATLKKRRKNPHQLVPDDLLVIPEQESKSEDVPVDSSIRIVVQRQPVFLRVRVLDVFGNAVASSEGTIETERGSVAVTSDNDGIVRAQIPRATKRARLKIGGLSFQILVGALQPADFLEGVRARLINLGHWAGQSQVDDAGGEGEFKLGVELFQDAAGLPVDGVLTSELADKVTETHGQ